MERKWHEEKRDGYILIVNEGGKNLGYSSKSGFWSKTAMPLRI